MPTPENLGIIMIAVPLPPYPLDPPDPVGGLLSLSIGSIHHKRSLYDKLRIHIVCPLRW